MKTSGPLYHMVCNGELTDCSGLALVDSFILVGRSVPGFVGIGIQEKFKIGRQIGLELANGTPGTFVLGESVVGKFKVPLRFD